MCLIGHEVTMFLWVECTKTQKTLIGPDRYVYNVHPPVWTQGDDVSLEMWLDLHTKIKFLGELRKKAETVVDIKRHIRTNDFIIRGTMERWIAPANHAGERRSKTYPSHQLRYA